MQMSKTEANIIMLIEWDSSFTEIMYQSGDF